jgi:hypothetical protein
MPDGAKHAVLGFPGKTVKQVGPGLILLGQRERAIACSAYVVSRDHRPSPARQTRRSLALRRRERSSRSVSDEASRAAWGATVTSVTPDRKRSAAYVMLPGMKQRTFGWPSR